MGQGKDVKNAFGRSGGCTGSEKRYLAKEWGCHHLVTPRPTGHLGLPAWWARATNPRSPGRWCLLLPVAPHLQHLPMCGPFTPHLPAMASLLPKSTPTGLQGLADLAENGEKAGPWPFRCHLCLPPLPFLPHPLHLVCSWELQISSLCYKELYAWDMDTWLYIVKLQ